MSVPYWLVKTGLFSSWQHITYSCYCRCLRILGRQFFKNPQWQRAVTQMPHLSATPGSAALHCQWCCGWLCRHLVFVYWSKDSGHQLLINSLQYGIKSRKAFLGGATCLFNSIYNNVKIVVQRKGGVFVCVHAWSTCLVYVGISRKGR